ncbi:MAG: hypothetical protein QXF76_04935 [Candidatus Anstonellales archaeon]
MSYSRKIIQIILAVLIFNSIFLSYWPFPSNKNVPLAESLVYIYGLGLLISISVITISYMIGSAFNLKNAVVYAKTEIVYLIYTIVIFLVLAALDAILNEITYSLTGNVDLHIHLSEYLYDFRMKLINMYIHFEILEFTIGILSSINYAVSYVSLDAIGEFSQCLVGLNIPGLIESIPFLGNRANPNQNSGLGDIANQVSLINSEISMSAAPAAGLDIVSALHTMYVDMIAYAYVALLIIKVILDFVYSVAWPFLIPLGLAFMVFPIFRQVGTTILALSIVMYYVFPLTVLLGHEIYLRIDAVISEKDRGDASIISHQIGFLFDHNSEPKLDEDILKSFDNPNATEYYKYLFNINSNNPNSTFAPSISIQILEQNTKITISDQNTLWQKFGSAAEGISKVLKIVKDFVLMMGKVLLLMINSYEIYNGFALEIFHNLSVESIYIMFAFFQLIMSVMISISTYRDVSEALGGETDLFGLLERF